MTERIIWRFPILFQSAVVALCVGFAVSVPELGQRFWAWQREDMARNPPSGSDPKRLYERLGMPVDD